MLVVFGDNKLINSFYDLLCMKKETVHFYELFTGNFLVNSTETQSNGRLRSK